MFFSEGATYPGQLRCLGRNFLHNLHFLGKEPRVLGCFVAWDSFFTKTMFGGKRHLSWTASLPGADSFYINLTVWGKGHVSRAASLPGAELFTKKSLCWERTTCPGQLRCLGQNFFQKFDFLWKKPLVLGSFATDGVLDGRGPPRPYSFFPGRPWKQKCCRRRSVKCHSGARSDTIGGVVVVGGGQKAIVSRYY